MIMERWPNLFLVGAPKAGTSSLYAYLTNTEGIYMSPLKEPNFFSITIILENSTAKPIRDKKKYLSLFKKGEDQKFLGEASPEYLSDVEAPKLIHEVSPNAKIIISLRDPVERAFSSYFMFKRLGLMKSTFLNVLNKYLEKKKKGLKSPLGLLEMGLYYEPVNRYLNIFGPKQIKIIIFEEFIKEPKKTMEEVLEFLDIKSSIDNFKEVVYNKYGVPRGPFLRLLLKDKTTFRIIERFIPTSARKFLKENLLMKNEPKPKINLEARKILVDFYKEDVEKLEKLLGKKFPWKNFQFL